MAALPDDSLQMVKWKEDQFRQIKESELSRRLSELAMSGCPPSLETM